MKCKIKTVECVHVLEALEWNKTLERYNFLHQIGIKNKIFVM